jgi:hypothetical protein
MRRNSNGARLLPEARPFATKKKAAVNKKANQPHAPARI